ncbi:MAG: hypothetical protein KBF50_12220 [Steroidobacteraceae bacterium]|nr:hypothetical protein [Steroidobacteraceae bacterium]
MSGGGGGQTSTTTQNIPDELKPLATAFTNKAIGVGETGYQPYSSPRFAGLTGVQNAGIGQTVNRALGGSDVIDAGSNYLTGQLGAEPMQATRNEYAGSNPYLQQQIDASLGDVTRNYNLAVRPQQVAANVGSGSFGNSGLAEMQGEQERQLAGELGRVSSGMRFQDYTQQQQLGENFASRNDAMQQAQAGQKLNAAQLGLNYGNQAYTDAGQLMQAGQTLQDQQQQGLDFDYQQFLEQQNLPYKQLAAMSGVFGSNLGGSSTTTQTGGGK